MAESSLKDLDVHIHIIMDKKTYPGWTDIRQSVDVHSFYWIREGRGVFRAEDGEGNGETLAVQSGLLLYLRPGLRLAMETAADQPLRIAMVMMSISKTSWNRNELGGTVVAGSLPLPFKSEWRDLDAMRLHELFQRLLEAWAPGQEDSELLTKSLVYQLLCQLHQMCKRGEGAAGKREERLFYAIKSELERRFGENMKLHQFAASFNISETYMRILFHRHLKMSPKSYLNELRNEHAKRQLLYTDYTMKEIAGHCGYADEFHFSKSFKKQNGLPPKLWRESLEPER